jgi:hypothetical protein
MNRIIQIAIGQRSEHELGIMRRVFINVRNKPFKNKVGSLNVIETYEQVVNDPLSTAFIGCWLKVQTFLEMNFSQVSLEWPHFCRVE